MAMVITKRACLLVLGAMLSQLPLGGALADPAPKPAITGLISTGITVSEFGSITPTMITNRIPNLFLSTDGTGTDLTGIFGGLVIQVAWSTLEPTQPTANGPVSLVTDRLDAALAAVATYNLKAMALPPPNSRTIGVRLRIYSGCNDAPDWATSLDGAPITIHAYYGSDSDGNPDYETCTIGRFWDHGSKYAQAWQQFQTALAAKYDTNSLIQEVAVTSCASFSAEPFFLPYLTGSDGPPDDDTMSVLNANQYHVADYQDCLSQAVAVDYAPWHTTRLEFSFNPFSGVLSPPNDITFSERVMRICRKAAGQRCILSNHDLGAVPPSPSTILPIYALERKFGPNLTYQTFLKTPADYEGTIRKGVSLGAGAIEVWPDGYQPLGASTLQSWALMFEPQ
jgi:hypothetical protein